MPPQLRPTPVDCKNQKLPPNVAEGNIHRFMSGRRRRCGIDGCDASKWNVSNIGDCWLHPMFMPHLPYTVIGWWLVQCHSIVPSPSLSLSLSLSSWNEPLIKQYAIIINNGSRRNRKKKLLKRWIIVMMVIDVDDTLSPFVIKSKRRLRSSRSNSHIVQFVFLFLTLSLHLHS